MAQFEMTDTQLATMTKACRPVLMIALQCGDPPSPQANANAAWRALGQEMGFKYMTVKTVPGGSNKIFTAEPVDVG